MPVILKAQLEDWDSDQDAMPNGWELYRDLDVNDSRDAWQDPDGDGIINLYEYYLGSDPQDRNQPRFVDLPAGQNLSDALHEAGRGVVLRISEGNYPLNFRLTDLSDPPRVLLQGGWNADFTERDHCRYPTVLDGGENGAVFDLLIAAGNSTSLILDGFTLKGGSSGAIQFTGYLAKAQLLLANCRIINNRAHRASAILNFADGEGASLISDLILVNTLITGNRGTAIRTEQFATRSNFKLLHSIIAFNQAADNDSEPLSSGHALDISAHADSTFYLQIVNTILWGNENVEVKLNASSPEALKLAVTNNIFGFLAEEVQASLFFHPSNRSIDPLLGLSEGFLLSIEDLSPAFGSGKDIGYFADMTPDIGAEICEVPFLSSSHFRHNREKSWSIFPQPARSEIMLRGSLPHPARLKTIIYDTSGQMIRKQDYGRQTAGERTLSLPLHSLASGPYILEIQAGLQRYRLGFIKQ